MRDLLTRKLVRSPLEVPAMRLRTLVKRFSMLRHPELKEIYLEDDRASKVMEILIRPDSNCIDVGCHIGSVLSQICRLAPEGQHTAFEPTPDKAKHLSYLFPEVDVRQIALSNDSGETSFYVSEGKSGYSSLNLNRTIDRPKKIYVQMEKMDNIDLKPDKIDFIKIDVEGAELAVLRGAEKLLRRDSPSIIFESTLDGLGGFGLSPGDIWDFLKRLDYEIFLFRDYLSNAEPLGEDSFCVAHQYPFGAFSFIAVRRHSRARIPSVTEKSN